VELDFIGLGANCVEMDCIGMRAICVELVYICFGGQIVWNLTV
jgi:hypothetical protein